jgi:hypothetical protein
LRFFVFSSFFMRFFAFLSVFMRFFFCIFVSRVLSPFALCLFAMEKHDQRRQHDAPVLANLRAAPTRPSATLRSGGSRRSRPRVCHNGRTYLTPQTPRRGSHRATLPRTHLDGTT